MREKGQTIIYDFMISFIIFVLFVFALNLQWSIKFDEIQEKHLDTKMRKRGIQAIQVLVKSPGYPKDWNSENAEVIGLAERENILSQGKISELQNISYSDAKGLLLLAEYDFWLQIDALGEENDLNFGQEPQTPETAVRLKRDVLLNGGNANVYLTVYEQ